MADALKSFCEASSAALRADPGPGGREQVRRMVETLVADPEFVETWLGSEAPLGKRTLYEDAELGFVVLGYRQDKPHRSPPHDHGRSWAIYAQADAYTDMTLYRRLDGGEGPVPRRSNSTDPTGSSRGMPGSMTGRKSTPSTIRPAPGMCGSPAATWIACRGCATTWPPARRRSSRAPRRPSDDSSLDRP